MPEEGSAGPGSPTPGGAPDHAAAARGLDASLMGVEALGTEALTTIEAHGSAEADETDACGPSSGSLQRGPALTGSTPPPPEEGWGDKLRSMLPWRGASAARVLVCCVVCSLPRSNPNPMTLYATLKLNLALNLANPANTIALPSQPTPNNYSSIPYP